MLEMGGQGEWRAPGVIGGAGGDRGREPAMPEGSPPCRKAAHHAGSPKPAMLEIGGREPPMREILSPGRRQEVGW